MATKSKIEWTEMTWNPVTGCSKISSGCQNCYAERMANRLKLMGVKRYENGFNVTLHYDLIDLPKKWKLPRIIFVNSMSDLFHEEVPKEFIKSVFKTMNESTQHIFQILTKRSQRLVDISQELDWTSNIWMGVTVEDSNAAYRIDDLRKIPSAIRFLSCEPLLSPLDGLHLEGIDWIITGGESGPFSRPVEKEWIESLHNQSVNMNIPFFFKQWGGTRKKYNGRTLNNKIYSEMPYMAINNKSNISSTNYL